MSSDSLLEFPCDFPIKAIGRGDNLPDIVYNLIHPHIPGLKKTAITTRPSGKGNFIAVTIIFNATSQAQIDAIYLELTHCDHVIMAL
jgi:putative lipoic acid-binding regulatory protein